MVEYLVGFVTNFVSFGVGVAGGYWLYGYAHRQGVKLVDRIGHNQEPYVEPADDSKVQMVSGGDFEEVE